MVLARDRDRADVVEAPDVVSVRELDDVLRAVDVRALGGLLVGLDVVDGGEVEEVVDRLLEAPDPERRPRQVARDRLDAALRGAQPLQERVELAPRPFADEHVDRALALEQLGQKMPSDEARRAGDEVVQGPSTPPVCGRIDPILSGGPWTRYSA